MARRGWIPARARERSRADRRMALRDGGAGAKGSQHFSDGGPIFGLGLSGFRGKVFKAQQRRKICRVEQHGDNLNVAATRGGEQVLAAKGQGIGEWQERSGAFGVPSFAGESKGGAVACARVAEGNQDLHAAGQAVASGEAKGARIIGGGMAIAAGGPKGGGVVKCGVCKGNGVLYTRSLPAGGGKGCLVTADALWLWAEARQPAPRSQEWRPRRGWWRGIRAGPSSFEWTATLWSRRENRWGGR